MKKCSKCKISYELSAEFFQRNRAAKDGFGTSCKPCSHKREKEYRKNNKEKISLAKKKCYNNKKEYYLKRTKEYSEANKEHLKKKSKEYRERNIETFLKNGREHYSKNKESYKKRATDWNKNNKKRRKEILSKYNKKNPAKGIFSLAKRRAIKKQAIPPWADMKKIKLIYKKAKWLESITGLKYHVDHVIPLQGKNVCGLHIWENLQILEASENIKKGNRYVT